MKVKLFLVFILIVFICTPAFAQEESFSLQDDMTYLLEDIASFIKEYHVVLVIVSWVIAFGIGFLIVNAWKKKMDTVQLKTQADIYVVPDSLNFKTKKDSFLYSTVTKTPRQTSSGTGGMRMSGRRR